MAGLPAKRRSSDRAGAVEAAAIAWKDLASNLQTQAVSLARENKRPPREWQPRLFRTQV